MTIPDIMLTEPKRAYKITALIDEHSEAVAALTAIAAVTATRGGRPGRLLQRAVTAAVVTRTVTAVIGTYQDRRATKDLVSVTIHNADPLYAAVATRLAHGNNLTAATMNDQIRVYTAPSDREFTIDTPHGKIFASVQAIGAPKTPGNATVNSDGNDYYETNASLRMQKMMLRSKSNEAIVLFLEDAWREHRRSKRDPMVHVPTIWGGWRGEVDIPPRKLDSIVLPADVKAKIVDDLGNFLNLEDVYAEAGLPYHRGFLFHGPPGTGKTSLARALATHFGLNIYHASLAAVKDDEKLNELITSVPTKSILLLEDIDTLRAAKARKPDVQSNVDMMIGGPEYGGGITMSGLLQALDGVSTPHGLITIMTTNDASGLDDALVRAGRIDQRFEIPIADLMQQQAIVKLFAGVDLPFGVFPLLQAPADLIEIIKGTFPYRDDLARVETTIRDGLGLLS